MLVYVNNVHITIVYHRIRPQRRKRLFFLQKGNKFFLLNISLCFYTKAAKREKLTCGDQTASGRLLPALVPPSFPAAGLCILRCAVCVDFVLQVTFFFFFCSHLLFVGRERSGGEEEMLRLAPTLPLNKVLRNKLKKKVFCGLMGPC